MYHFQADLTWLDGPFNNLIIVSYIPTIARLGVGGICSQAFFSIYHKDSFSTLPFTSIFLIKKHNRKNKLVQTAFHIVIVIFWTRKYSKMPLLRRAETNCYMDRPWRYLHAETIGISPPAFFIGRPIYQGTMVV